jgi:hypothetical protein
MTQTKNKTILKKTLWLWGPFFLLLGFVWFWSGKVPQIKPQVHFDNGYFYENKDLGFSLSLPASFKYFQTQRKKGDKFVEIEFFVPTSDKYYHQLVPGYARAFVIRLIDKKDYDSYKDGQVRWQKIGQRQNKIYLISFWAKPPADWQDKWSQDLEEKIKQAVTIK